MLVPAFGEIISSRYAYIKVTPVGMMPHIDTTLACFSWSISAKLYAESTLGSLGHGLEYTVEWIANTATQAFSFKLVRMEVLEYHYRCPRDILDNRSFACPL